MKSLYEVISQINEQNGDLNHLLTKYPVLTNDKGEGWLVLVQLKNPSDENKFQDAIYKGSTIFIAKDHSGQKNLKAHKEWGFIKLKPKINGNNQQDSTDLNQSTIRKLKATKIKSIDFTGSGFPHRGPATSGSPVEYEAIYYKFDPATLTKLASSMDGDYYVVGGGSTIFGMSGLDKKVAWEPFDEFFRK